jgi:hypothetical protein
MTSERIEFSLVEGNEEVFPPPYPATKEVPDWFKSLPTEAEFQGHTIPTVKICPPFIEAMTCGYIIPLAADITLTLDKKGTYIGKGPTCYEQSRFAHIMQIHPAPQVQGAPFANYPVVKILNPWLIRTPPGYSTLFLPLLNRYLYPLFPLAGLVETDVFYREINFPSVLMIAPGTTLALPRGTPLVQVIPIKRDDFQSEILPLDQEKYKTARPTDPAEKTIFYKKHFWIKKSYR